MNVTRNPLSLAVRTALLFGLVVAVPVGRVHAQSANSAGTQDAAQQAAPADQNPPPPPPNPQQAQRLQTVTVTGSRIRSADVATQQPVFVMSREDIAKTGLATTGDIIQHMTITGTPAFNKQAPLSSGEEVGGSYVDMRNLGSQRVLILVNGKRWVSSLNGLVDVSNIPASLIERVEVLKDGASSVYGSDAISGVVNFILRDHFDGNQLNAYYGQNSHGDGVTKEADLTMGGHNDKGSIVFNTSYNEQGTVWARDRQLTRYAYGPRHPTDGDGTGPWGRITDPAGNALVLDHSGNDDLGQGTGADSRDPANYHAFTGDPTDLYNSSWQMMLRTPIRTASAFLQGKYNFNENVDFKATAMYADRSSNNQVAGYPLTSTSQPQYPVYVDGDSYYNPFPGNDLSFARRTIEIPRLSKNDYQSFHFDGTLEGWFDVGEHEWNWDAGFTYNKGRGEISGSGNLFLPALKAALGPSFLNADGVVQCGTAAAPIPLGTDYGAGQCTPFDILGGPGASTADALAYVNTLSHETYGNTSKIWSANITGGLFNLPGGEFSFAGGLESRGETGFDKPDIRDQDGLTTNLAAGSTSGHYRVNEAYVEFNAPLLSDLPGARELSLDAASRYSHYSNFGSTVNNKYGFKWKPIDDLLVRGNYAEGFRAPTIGDLFGGGSQSFDYYLDPCDSEFGAASSSAAVAARCTADGVPAGFRQLQQSGQPISSPGGAQSATPFNTGVGNADLQPERAVTKTLGLVYSPAYAPGLDLSLDWYDIRIDNLISGISANYVLTQCYVGNSPTYCDQFARNPTTHQIVALDRGNANLGWLETAGYDFEAHYRLPEFGFGRLALNLESVYIDKYEQQSAPGANVDQLVGQWNTNSQTEVPIYRVRANLGLDWSKGDWGATWMLRYFGAYRDICWDVGVECNQPGYTSPTWGQLGANRKGAIAFNDVQVRWNAPWNATIALGVNNIFDRKPPISYAAFVSGTSSASSVDPNMDIDRYMYVRYQQRF